LHFVGSLYNIHESSISFRCCSWLWWWTS